MENKPQNNELSGVLLIDKPVGETSFKQISKLRKKLGIKKIGHCGTLDPLASGVLVLCVNKATKISDYLLNDDKEYIAGISFGSATNTDDKEGEVINHSDKLINRGDLTNSLNHFRGEIDQIPPQFSAIKIKGKKAYELARKNIEVKISPRKVFIKKLELIDFDYENQTATVNVACSKGTYIRSLARDIGEFTGAFAHLNSLKRTKSGQFSLYSDDFVFIRNIDSEKKEDILSSMVSISDSLSRFVSLSINDDSVDKVKYGQKISPNDIDWDSCDMGGFNELDPRGLYVIIDRKSSAMAIVDGNLRYKMVLI